MAEKTEYAISYSAIKFYPNGCADISNGIHIILATDEKSAELDAMKISLEKCSPGVVSLIAMVRFPRRWK